MEQPKNQLKDGLLISLFVRMIEVSDKMETSKFNVVRHDPTDGTNLKVFAFLEYGLTEELFIGPPTAEDFEEWQFFAACPVQNGPPPPQLVEISVQCIWGHDITVTDYMTGIELMNCYHDAGWSPRKSFLKPQKTLQHLLWHSHFIGKDEADRILACWSVGEDAFMEDPYGCLADYE